MRAKRRGILPFHLNTVNIASVVSSDLCLLKKMQFLARHLLKKWTPLFLEVLKIYKLHGLPVRLLLLGSSGSQLGHCMSFKISPWGAYKAYKGNIIE